MSGRHALIDLETLTQLVPLRQRRSDFHSGNRSSAPWIANWSNSAACGGITRRFLAAPPSVSCPARRVSSGVGSMSSTTDPHSRQLFQRHVSCGLQWMARRRYRRNAARSSASVLCYAISISSTATEGGSAGRFAPHPSVCGRLCAAWPVRPASDSWRTRIRLKCTTRLSRAVIVEQRCRFPSNMDRTGQVSCGVLRSAG